MGNSAKYTTTAHAHDADYLITQPINKHDTYPVLFVFKLGLVGTNHVCEFYSFKVFSSLSSLSSLSLSVLSLSLLQTYSFIIGDS